MKTQEERYSSPLDGVINVQIFNMSSAVKVYIHSPSEIPDSSSKNSFLDVKHYLKLTANVKFAIHSTDEIRSLSVSQRKCRFQEESNLEISPVYSYNLCQMQCRVDLAKKLCGCIPHFYKTRTPVPICNFRGLQCLAKEKNVLITLRTEGRRLCECLPLCNDVIYTTETESEIEWLLGTNLEVTMSKYPHMRLKRDILFGFSDLLARMQFFRFLELLLKNYLDNSSIHGLKYLIQPGRHWIERLFWIGTCTLSSYFCYFIQLATWKSYQLNAISFVPDTTYLYWSSGFPAVTVCEAQNNLKVWHLAERKAAGATDKLSKLSAYLGQMLYYRGRCDRCEHLCNNEMTCPINILELANEIFANCSVLLGDCSWNGVKIDCCDYFQPQLTSYGLCYVINSLQTMKANRTREKSRSLKSNRATGPGMLRFKYFITSQIHVHSPEDILYFGDQGGPDITYFSLGMSTSVYFRIKEIVNDPEISKLSINQRGCILPVENPLKIYRLYSSSACIAECQFRAQLSLCGCNHHYAPKANGFTKTCDLDGMFCLQKYADFLNSMDAQGSKELNISCNCAIPSCTEPEYVFLKTDGLPLDNENWSSIELKMISLPTERYRRNVVRSQLDLVAFEGYGIHLDLCWDRINSFASAQNSSYQLCNMKVNAHAVSTGGAIGLFFGASIISLVEFIMFVFIRNLSRRR